MKKISLLVLLSAIALIGCGTNQPSSNNPIESSNEPESTEPDKSSSEAAPSSESSAKEPESISSQNQNSSQSSSAQQSGEFNGVLDYLSKKDTSKPLNITATNNSAFTNQNGVITFSETDEYTISGYFKGQIVVSAADAVIVLNDAYIESERVVTISYTHDVKDTELCIKAQNGTENFVISTAADATINSVRELSFDGKGTLTVVGDKKHGVKAKTIKSKGEGTFYFQGSTDGSALNCNKYKHKADVGGSIYLLNSKNGIKSDEYTDIGSGNYYFYNDATGIKTDLDPYDDDGVTPVDRYITIGEQVVMNFKNVSTQFTTIEGKLTNAGKVNVL